MGKTSGIDERGESSNRETYVAAIDALERKGVDYLIGGGHAFNAHTGIGRRSGDFDLFVRETDRSRAFEAVEKCGFETELTFPHWLSKLYRDGATIDLIHNSGNGVARVDDGWFFHALEGELWGRAVRFCPAEELIWTKAFIMERERFDGAEINHLLHSCAEDLDWPRLLARFGPHWPVLLAHLVLFQFAYPFDRRKLRYGVTQLLLRKLRAELVKPPPDRKVCNGTLLSRAQYLVDIEEWGYLDGRIDPPGNMTKEDVEQWTRAMKEEGIID
ncbi:MAG: nucleotidyltransferase [Thermoanaerobaculia bacterium]|nr:nucleotidyltransferase [Thermoanaerobaculia bacterium]